jgi:hypothetical protein
MAIPTRIPVSRQVDYYSGYIGQYQGENQFWGQIVAQFAHDMPHPPPSNLEPYKRWYAVLHKFDCEGHHIGTDCSFIGTTADGEPGVFAAATETLNNFIAVLEPVQYGDIAIRLFQLEIEQNIFGLIDISDGPDEAVAMMPGDLVFYDPWDGNYDT